ncbi:unnamed protein product [Toxocara canis]|uniref:CHAD domain-containing protein n=1 Tax=Toxocara canis TaxID=6265 RepID=A0A183UCF8_TOXCA|nr:unnamed protein product [Toxocara canis]
MAMRADEVGTTRMAADLRGYLIRIIRKLFQNGQRRKRCRWGAHREEYNVESLKSQVKRARELRAKALNRLKRLRKIVRSKSEPGQYIDEIITINKKYGGGELYYVNTPTTRAWFLMRDESWIYIERENDESFSLLYSVKKLYKTKYLIRALAE